MNITNVTEAHMQNDKTKKKTSGGKWAIFRLMKAAGQPTTRQLAGE